MQKILAYIDNLICNYLGIHHQDIKPDSIRISGNQLTFRNTESFKRHLHDQTLDNFLTTQLTDLNPIDKKKLGISMGKAIANNLIISFDATKIRRE